MIGPQTLLQAEVALAEREREIEAISRQARLLEGVPRREGIISHAVATWFGDLAARLAPRPSEPECCLQLA